LSSDRENRDILVYFLWGTGKVTNERLGQMFGATDASISHIIKAFKERLDRESRLHEKARNFYSQFKI
jgi:hypothetical protein